MTPNEIRREIAKKDLSLKIIAEALDTTPASVGQVIKGTLISTRIAKAIAKLIDYPFLDVFPNYEEVMPRIDLKVGEKKRKIEAIKKLIA